MSQVELTTLGKSCEFFNGKAHEKSIDENGKYIVVNSKFISSEGKSFKRTNEQMFPLYKGDIVMVMSDVPNGKALAKCFIIDEDDTYSLNQRICCIRSKEFDTKYLYYQLNRNEHFLAFNNGENQTNLRKDDILDCPLIKPSLEEQKRMVAELDEAFAKVDKAIINIKNNLLNATELFDSKLYELFGEKHQGWKENTLGELCSIGDGNYSSKYPKASEFVKTGIPFLTATNLKNGTIVPEEIRYISREQHLTLKKGHIKKDDLVIVVRGSSTGNNSIVPIEFEGSNLNSQLAFLRVKESIIDSEYLFTVFNSPFVMNKVKSEISGAAQPQLPNNKLLDIKISYPSIAEQRKIVEVSKRLKDYTNALQNSYEKKLENIEELKSGILKRAFENELIEAE